MADYIENSSVKLDFAMPFQRTGKFPLDRSSMFSSYADAVKYAKGDISDPDERGLCGSSYIGQQICVYENNTVTYYKIDADRTLTNITLDISNAKTNQVVSISTVNESGVPTSYSTISPITDAALEDMLTETLGSYTIKQNASTLILNSSTQDSTKQFEITIDDTGTITAQEL